MSFKGVRGWFWNPYSRIGARWHGWLDARLDPPLPRWEAQEPAPYLRQLHEAADLEIGDLIHGFVKRDAPMDAKLQHLVADERRLHQEVNLADAKHTDAEERFSTLNPGVPASTAEHRVWTYWLVVAFLLLGEIPFNGTVFQVLREGQVFNYLISAVIGILTLLAAHYAGVHLRQKPFADRSSTVMFAVALAVPLLTVFVIASLRQYYLHARQLVDPQGERIAYFAFLSTNLLMFAVAFYMSWFSHLVGAEQVTRARRSLARLTKALKSTERALRAVRAARMNLHRRYVTHARQALDGFWQLVHVYTDVNIRRRNDRKNRESDLLLTDAARQSLHVNIPRVLQADYLDYRDQGSAEVRSVGATVTAGDQTVREGSQTQVIGDSESAASAATN